MRPQRVIPFLLFVGSLVFAGQAPAQEQEIEAAQRKLEALKREAVELEEQGRPDAAGARRRDAEKMARYIHDMHAKMQGKKQAPDADPKRILGGLEHGIVALRALGRNEEAEHLMEIARDYQRQHDAHAQEKVAKDKVAKERAPKEKAAKDRPAKETDGGAREREVAVAQLELLGLAMKAMQEAERPDAADMLERAIVVRKLALAGRADEARQAREGAPGREQLAELTAHASKLWAGWGHEKNAEQLARLSRELAGKKPDQPAERKDVGKDSGKDGAARIEHLERQLADLRQALEQMKTELRQKRL